MKPWLKELIKYSSATAFAVGIFFLTISLRNIYTQTSLKEIFRFLSDGFVIPGVVLIGVGLLVIVSNFGALRGIGYALKHAVIMLLPFINGKHETYAEYVARKKPLKGFGFLFIVGGVFLTAGIIFAILFGTIN